MGRPAGETSARDVIRRDRIGYRIDISLKKEDALSYIHANASKQWF
jgi:hypothetical protein